jgi:ABC-type sugar transport system ATPase subunit
MNPTNPAGPILRAQSIVKKFGGAAALAGVDLEVSPGEVHALLGANGAGKSTLIKVIAGIHLADSGAITWMGGQHRFRDLRESMAAGIATMFQQLNVVEDLSVRGYLSLGRERTRFGLVDHRAESAVATEALARVGVDIDIRRSMRDLSVAERELVEIARAVSMDARLVIMDEPTASLGEAEVERLFGVIHGLRRDGVSVIYVSHKLKEVLDICDRATVLRDGRNAGTVEIRDVSTDDLLELMVGHQPVLATGRARQLSTSASIELVNVSTVAGLRGVNLSVREGEIFGLYGLMGAGRTELLRAIYGLDPLTSGSMTYQGSPWEPKTPTRAVRSGVGLVPEDRVREAMIPDASVADNLVLSAPSEVTRGVVVSRRREASVADASIRRIGIKVPSLSSPITALSGGNQQKVVLGRWLLADSRLLLLDDPTVGVDVAAKNEIYRLVREMAESGRTVIVSSSELDELLALCDRIAVMHRGAIVNTIHNQDGDARVLIRQSITGAEPEPGRGDMQ